MREGWRRLRLRDICRFLNGRAYNRTELLPDGKYPVLRVGNFFTNDHWYYSDLELEANKYCDSGDLLYAWSASFGPRLWTGGKVIYHYHIWKIEPHFSVVDQRFLFHFLGWDVDQIKKDLGAGTTMVHVSKGSMEERPLWLPPLPEQQRIVAILDEAFAAIATAKANAEKNLQNARAVFDSFLDAVFTAEPVDASRFTLGEVCEIVGGSQPPKSVFSNEYKDGYVRLIQIRDYKSDDHIVYIPRSLARRFCSKADVMIGRYGPPVFQILEGLTGAYNVALMKAIPNENLLTRDYLFHFLMHGTIQRHIIFHSERASGQTGINKELLEKYPIALPSLSRQADAATAIRQLRAETLRLESLYRRKLAALDELKKSLLHRAFNGDL